MAINVGDAVWTISGDVSGLDNALRSGTAMVGAATTSMLSSLQKVGLGMTALGAAIALPLKKSIDTALDFRSAMAEVAALGVDDLDKLSDAVVDVSTKYGLDLVDGAMAAKAAISSAATEFETPLILEKAARAAVAGTTDLETALKFGIQTASSFGIEYSNMETVLNDAFLAVKHGIVEFDDLASSVGRVAPIFNAAGLSSHELFAAIAALTKGGLSGAEAVTALRGVITGIISPTSEASELAEALGINFNATALKSQSLSGFVDQLNTAIQNSSASGLAEIAVVQQQITALEQKGQLTAAEASELDRLREKQAMLSVTQGESIEQFGALFGNVRALVGILGLATEQNEYYNMVLKDTTTTTDAMNQAFQRTIETDPTYTWKQLKSELQALGLVIGDALIPALSRVAEILKPLVSFVADFAKQHEGLASAIIIAIGAVDVLLLTLGPLLIMLPGLKLLFGALGVMFIGVAGILSGPVLLAIGAVIAAGVALYAGWDYVKAGAAALWNGIKATFELGKNVVVGIWEGIKIATGAAWDAISGIVIGVAGGIWDFIKSGFNGLRDFFAGVWESITGIFNKAWDAISGTIGWILDGVSAAIRAAGSLLGISGGGAPAPAYQPKASGGPVSAGHGYIVGEQGPEWFQPGVSGQIFSAPQTAAAMAGGGVTVNINGISIASNMDIDAVARRLGDKLQQRLSGVGRVGVRRRA